MHGAEKIFYQNISKFIDFVDGSSFIFPYEEIVSNLAISRLSYNMENGREINIENIIYDAELLVTVVENAINRGKVILEQRCQDNDEDLDDYLGELAGEMWNRFSLEEADGFYQYQDWKPEVDRVLDSRALAGKYLYLYFKDILHRELREFTSNYNERESNPFNSLDSELN